MNSDGHSKQVEHTVKLQSLKVVETILLVGITQSANQIHICGILTCKNSPNNKDMNAKGHKT